MARGNILVVDDETLLLEVFVDYFGERGFQVDTASEASDALQKAARAAYSLIILDIKMSGMDGVEALEKLKQLQPQAKFILMTGYWDQTLYLHERAKRVGIFKLVEKPFEMSDMLLLAEEALSAP